eukprot:TRINITY_DN4139_c0_g1_i1.p1 TRINITY_DN4139_c0_g1~~TRINITY_DN4139_c0_g1_i1.p1  ORF type:complete len:723 (-),score=137.05 TRINITY_DN4139_c0_g1_i1:14-1858(-)
MFSGIGRDPAPNIKTVELVVEDSILSPRDNSQLTEMDIPTVFPRYCEVLGAGCGECNGIYKFKDIYNHKPYYLKQITTEDQVRPALWYFYTTHISRIYNGWYISKFLDTSSVSAGNDYYSAYIHPKLPPTGEWVTRFPGLSPTAGCGIEPAPILKRVSDTDGYGTVFLLSIQLPDSKVITIPCIPEDTIEKLQLKIQAKANIPLYYQRIFRQSSRLLSDLKLKHLAPQTYNQAPPMLVLETITPIPVDPSPQQIVVVGAGPVGLWTAIQIKSLHPLTRVSCFERRTEYARTHALRIDDYAFDDIISPDLKKFTESLQIFRKNGALRIRTTELEDRLRQLAHAISVEMIFEEVEGLEWVLERYKKIDAIVVADGARSRCRRSAFPEGEYLKSRKLGSLLQVKFDAFGEIQKSSGTLQTFLSNLPASKQFFNILPAKYDETENVTPITLFSLLNDEIFGELEALATSGKPCQSIEELEQNLQPRSVQVAKDIAFVLNKQFPDGIKQESVKISVIPASYHVIRSPTCLYQGNLVLFAGDAAMGLSLEKGLNYGWNIATKLANFIAFSKDLKVAQSAYYKYFKTKSTEAINLVETDYSSYVNLVKAAGVVRSLVKVFI